MGGFGDRALDVKVEYRLCPAALFGKTSPAGIALTCCAVSRLTVPDEIDVHALGVGGPMLMKIIEKGRPVLRQVVSLDIAKREGETVINAYKGKR